MAGWSAAAPARPHTSLADGEVLTIECVGEFRGTNTDKGLYEHFRCDWDDWFPALGRIRRTTFTRQAANLWVLNASSAGSCSVGSTSTRGS